MDNSEVAHLWAHKARSQAHGSHFYFEGDTIYSYGSHFPIARHYKGVVLFTDKTYSVTTARHKSEVQYACSHLTTFTVSNPLDDPSGKDVREYAQNIKQAAERVGRARNADAALEHLNSLIADANRFCAHFGFSTRFSPPENIEALKERAKASMARERKANAAKRARDEKAAAASIAEWMAGRPGQLSVRVERVYLRAKDGNMETSKGAVVPLADAERTYHFVQTMRVRGWRRNGDQHAIGSYQLDAVNDQGVVAGCHRLTWAEIERFAATQGWKA